MLHHFLVWIFAHKKNRKSCSKTHVSTLISNQKFPNKYYLKICIEHKYPLVRLMVFTLAAIAHAFVYIYSTCTSPLPRRSCHVLPSFFLNFLPSPNLMIAQWSSIFWLAFAWIGIDGWQQVWVTKDQTEEGIMVASGRPKTQRVRSKAWPWLLELNSSKNWCAVSLLFFQITVCLNIC